MPKNNFFSKASNLTQGSQGAKISPNDDCSRTNEGEDLQENKPRVRFHQITVREYNRTLGDNPSVSAGPPISLDWEYNTESEILTIEDYEAQKPQKKTRLELIVPRHYREELLKLECGFSRRQIAASVRSVNAAKANRRQTVNNLNFSKTLEKIETMKRALGRVVGIRKSSEEEIDILWQKAVKELDVNHQRD